MVGCIFSFSLVFPRHQKQYYHFHTRCFLPVAFYTSLFTLSKSCLLLKCSVSWHFSLVHRSLASLIFLFIIEYNVSSLSSILFGHCHYLSMFLNNYTMRLRLFHLWYKQNYPNWADKFFWRIINLSYVNCAN